MKKDKLLALVNELDTGTVIDLAKLQGLYLIKEGESISKSYCVKVLGNGGIRYTYKNLPKRIKDKIINLISEVGSRKTLKTIISNIPMND